MSASNIEWGEIMKLQVYLNRKRWSGQYVLLSPGEMTSGLVKVQWEDGVSWALTGFIEVGLQEGGTREVGCVSRVWQIKRWLC